MVGALSTMDDVLKAVLWTADQPLSANRIVNVALDRQEPRLIGDVATEIAKALPSSVLISFGLRHSIGLSKPSPADLADKPKIVIMALGQDEGDNSALAQVLLALTDGDLRDRTLVIVQKQHPPRHKDDTGWRLGNGWFDRFFNMSLCAA